MPYSVFLRVSARGRSARAHVTDLPGCSVMDDSREHVLARVPAAIASYLAWLRKHGEPFPPLGDTTAFEILGESIGQVARHPGDQAALLPPDMLPLADEDIAQYLRLMRFSRSDLLGMVEELSDSVLDWQPPRGWTVRMVLQHLSAAERWYLDRLGLYVPLQRQRTVFAHMAVTRELAYGALSSLTQEQRSRVVEKGGELWTARKVFRRFLEHEREHAGQIMDILTEYYFVAYPRTLCFVLHGDDVLLLKGAATKRLYANLYNGVGGHVERNEDVLSSLYREVREETGLAIHDPQLRAVIVADEEDRPGVVIFVYTATSGSRDVKASAEGELVWAPRSRLLDYDLVPDLRELLPRLLDAGTTGILYGHYAGAVLTFRQ